MKTIDKQALETISTRTVGQRIRYGSLPAYSDGGNVRCSCHPDISGIGQTESLRFWQKGMKIGCSVTNEWSPALAVHEKLGIVIDTRL